MYCWWLLILCILGSSDGWLEQKKFKDDFLLGVSSAAYQVEGAWNVDGKGESIWDRFLHDHPDVISDGSNGDVASDSYHLYHRDIEMLRELGVDFYRFSISWSRVLPLGYTYKTNEKGFDYYHNIIDNLLKYNIEPMITLYHYDLPQTLQDLGGWANPLSINWFLDYSRVIFERYADRVKYWVTFNEPYFFCTLGYGQGTEAPMVKSKGIGEYMCIKNVLVAHARVYRLYEKMYKSKYKGSIGISLNLEWIEPINNDIENVVAAEEYREFMSGLYMNPIWSKEGDFPKIVKDIIARKSKEQGFSKSRLPEFSSVEKKLLRGSADFVGVNHYSTTLVKRSETNYTIPSFEDDAGVDLSFNDKWMASQSPWMKSNPSGLYQLSMYLNQRYNHPTIFITEHGWSTKTGLNDTDRVEVLRRYLEALLLAIEHDTKCLGYSAWSLMDDYEWLAGKRERFGLYEVDFDAENKTRTARLSALVYKRIIEKRIIENDWQPKDLNITVSDKKLKKIQPAKKTQ